MLFQPKKIFAPIIVGFIALAGLILIQLGLVAVWRIGS